MVTRRIAVDLAKVYSAAQGGDLVATLAWGDEVKVERVTAAHVEIRLTRFEELDDGSLSPKMVPGFIRPTKSSGVKPSAVVAATNDVRVLKVDFVDVQQGDAAVVETPGGQVVLIDGGDNQLFARYLAGRYRGTRADKPKEIEAIVVTHGDADHFAGLTEIHKAETNPRGFKRLFIHPKRVYHNGLVKRPATKANGTRRKDVELLGRTAKVGGRILVTGLETNLLAVDDAQMNKPFRDWKAALKAWKKRGAITFKRLSRGDDAAFDFLRTEGVDVEVLGPMLTTAGAKEGLLFLGSPKKGPRIGHESLDLGTEGFKGTSASHTINGHSIILRLRYGRFHLLFSGDLNDQAARDLARAHNDGALQLRSEVFKVPHHGSADFSAAFFEAVSPIISVVSSGDESARKEYIHPRATLMGALGRYSRIAEPLVLVTELVAFFEAEGFITPERHKLQQNEAVIADGKAVVDTKAKGRFFAFRRTAFGIVKVRTDGDRLLLYTNSGQADLKEAYAYRMDDMSQAVPDPVRQV
jgi:beta-lactamase superfamily II metal-dependent hydrolase